MKKITICIFALSLIGIVSCGEKSNQPVAEVPNNVSAKIGSIEIVTPRVRAVLGGSNITAGYLTIKNSGDADKLLSVSSPNITAELHEHTNVDGMMQMRKVEFIDIPKSGEVKLEPGGYHIMLFNVPPETQEGKELSLSLKFEKSGEVTITAPVLQNVGGEMPMGKMNKDSEHQGH